MPNEAGNRANHRRPMADAIYIGSGGAVHRPRARHCCCALERALMRLELKRLPHPISTRERLRTAFPDSVMAVSASGPLNLSRQTARMVRQDVLFEEQGRTT